MNRLLGPSRPDWRWVRAVELTRQSQATAVGRLKAEDQAVASAYYFHRQAVHEDGQYEVIAAAHELFVNNQPMRSQVEALLLAGASDAEVAERCWCDDRVAHVYHDLFFDVRGGLHRPSWICAAVFGSAAHRGAHQKDLHGMLLRIAWFGGLTILEPYLAGRSFDPVDAKRFRQLIQSNLARLGLDLSFTSGSDAESTHVLIQLAADPKDSNEQDVDATTKVFKQFLSDLGPSVKLAAVSTGAKVMLPAREPRAHERMALAHESLTRTT